MSFVEHGYEVVRGAVHPQSLKILATEFQIVKDCVYLMQSKPAEAMQGDEQTPQSFSWYAAFCFESLMVVLKDEIERVTGKKLVPTYSYARIYYRGATLASHKDRPSCQYSATVCIENDERGPWPIYVEDYHGVKNYHSLEPGDMLIYRGDQLNHGRDDFTLNRQIQAFLHYVDVQGEYAHHAFDRRPVLGAPAHTRRP